MVPLIMAGIMAGQAAEKGKIAKSQAKTDKLTFKSNTKVENMRRLTDNTLAAAKGSLARFQQANGNKHKLQAGADAVESQRTNMLRASDAALAGSIEQRINSAQEIGALVAAAGGAGIGGGSVDVLNAATRVRSQRVQQMMDDQADTQQYDALRNIGQTTEATILGLDDIQFSDDINYMQAQAPYVKEPSWASIGLQAGMTFAQTFNSMGGFDGELGKTINAKLPGWLKGSTPKSATTTQLK